MHRLEDGEPERLVSLEEAVAHLVLRRGPARADAPCGGETVEAVDGGALGELVEQVARRGRAALERPYGVAGLESCGEP